MIGQMIVESVSEKKDEMQELECSDKRSLFQVKNEVGIENVSELQRKLELLELEYQKELIRIYEDYEAMIFVLGEVNRKINNLETQNRYLQSENAQYRKKLSLITDSWWGKVAIKVYHKLKKIKARFVK